MHALKAFPAACSLLAALAISTAVGSAATIDVAQFGGDIGKALGAASAGDTVLLGKGVYLVDSVLQVPSGVRLIGAGADATVIRYGASDVHDMLTVSGAEDVELAGFTLDGAMSGKAGQGIVGVSSSRLNIHDLVVRDFGATGNYGPMGIYFAKDVTQSRIADCTFTDIGVGAQYGSAIRLAWGSSGNWVGRNVIERTGRGGILANDGSTDLVITGNRVSGSGGEGLGIELWNGCGGSVVEDNVIDHWLSVDRSDLSAIRRNIISDKSGVFKYAGLEFVDSHDVVFADNVVDSGTIVGLSVSGAAPKGPALFARNTYNACSEWGAQLQGEAGGASELYLLRERFTGTLTKDKSAPYPGDAGHGIRINGNVRNLTLDGVEIAGNGRIGMQILAPNVDRISVINSAITKNGGSALSAPGIANLEWADTIVADNKGNRAPNPKGFADAKPQLSVTWPTGGKAGVPITFAALASVAGGTIDHWLWDLGSGIPSTDACPTVTYPRAGKYAVAVVVWDAAGRATCVSGDVVVE